VRSGVTHFHHGDWSGWRLRLNATALAWRFGFPVLFKLRREPQKAPYQVFVLDFQFADRQPIRDFAKRFSELYTLCARVHGLHG
jgi:hypothetical protein